ncbi:MAG: ubiquinone biosynthesis accessory factor UbiJ [Pseudomarimonas sp.]
MTNETPPISHPLLAPLGRALEMVINRALALDPETSERLVALNGRRIELHLQAPRLAMSVTVDGQRLRVGPVRSDGEPDLSLRATAGALFAMLLPENARTVPVGALKISGDAELAQRMQRLLRDFSPDLDAALAGVFGDIIGVQIARALRTAFASASAGAKRFAQDSADYLTEERKDVVSKVEQAIFFDEVDDLRDGVDRLAARVERLTR